jgi:hypothetical protein
MAAVRDVEDPIEKPPVNPAAMLPAPEGHQARFGLVG